MRVMPLENRLFSVGAILFAVLFALGSLGCGGSDSKGAKESAEGAKGAKAKEKKGSKASDGDKKGDQSGESEDGGDEETEGVSAPTDGNNPELDALVQDALKQIRRGKYEQAIEQAKQALRRNEKYSPAMVMIARAYYHLGKNEFAESICDIALSINSKLGSCHLLKGFVALKLNNIPLALVQFQKATEADPSLGPAWLNLGAQHLKSKNWAGAVAPLEKAVQLMPSRAEAHLNLGSAYRGNNEVVKAQQSFQKAIKIRPTYPQAYYNLGILYLDAVTFPGFSRNDQLNKAIGFFQKYKQQMGVLSKDDPVEGFIQTAQKEITKEQKRIERESKRKAREAAKKGPEGGKANAPATDGKNAPKKDK